MNFEIDEFWDYVFGKKKNKSKKELDFAIDFGDKNKNVTSFIVWNKFE